MSLNASCHKSAGSPLKLGGGAGEKHTRRVKQGVYRGTVLLVLPCCADKRQLTCQRRKRPSNMFVYRQYSRGHRESCGGTFKGVSRGCTNVCNPPGFGSVTSFCRLLRDNLAAPAARTTNQPNACII